VPSASLAVEWVPIERVFLSPANPRINDSAVPHVASSIRRFDWQQPIVAKRSGEVIAGNTRLKAAKSLGLVTVPVVWFEGSDLDAVAYQVADNVTLSTWDAPALAKILEHLRAGDAQEAVGFSTGEIDDLLARLEADGESLDFNVRSSKESGIGRADHARPPGSLAGSPRITRRSRPSSSR
jgi:ParB-like chromosome segregation protein Spo0J